MASTHRRRAASMKFAQYDATRLLSEDHQKVKRLFRQFDALYEDADRRNLVEQVCTELKAHAALEEELFYPAADGRIAEEMLLDEAQVDHDCARQLIAILENDELAPEERDATFKVLSEYVLHHIEAEETELFMQMRDAEIDLVELGAMMQSRRRQLHQEWGIVGESTGASSGRDDRVAVPSVD